MKLKAEKKLQEKRWPVTAVRYGTIALTVMLAIEAFAQNANEKRGFAPPGTAFGNNPFAAGKANNEALFEEDDLDEEEIDDISDEILRQRMEQRLRERANTTTKSAPGMGAGNVGGSRPGSGVDFNEAGSAIGANSITQNPNSKVTQGNRGPGCLALDPYTGYGPDIVTNFDFPDADIVEIAKTLGRLTCLNFILDKDVKGRISVVSNSSISVGDAWKAFLTALDVNGFSIIPSGKYLRIARQRDAKDKQIKTYSGEFSPDNDLYITRVLPLKYISAEEVARVFRNFMPPNTRILSYDQTNTLIVTDTGSNIKKIVDMVQLLDVEGFDEGLEVIRVKYASAQEIAKLIDQLLPGSGGGGAGGAPGAPGLPRFRGAGFAARKTKEGGVISHVIPDDRTNSVIVSANAKGLIQVKDLISKLDAKVTASVGGSRVHVVYLQFADAEQVANTLNNLASSGSGPKPVIAGAPTTTASLFEGSIKISADKPTNSLVITGTPSDFQTVKSVIARLDVPRDQVYVEAIIMEMSLDKSFELTTQVGAPNAGVGFVPNGAEFASFLTNPLAVPGFVMGFQHGSGSGSRSFSLPGSTQSITVASIQGLIKALQTNTNSNVLATPQILTLDNQEASIEIGENVPIPTSTAVPNAGIAQGVTYQKIALTLKIKPQINKISSFVKLEIDQRLEDIKQSATNSTVPAPTTINRASKTTVVVQDGDTVAMGGLVRNNVTERTTKIPLLGDIPLLGWLFRSKITANTKQNLLVFITPQIIKQYQNVRKILDKKIRQRDDFLEKMAGGNDPFEDYKLEMIKNLPPVSELKSGNRVENTDADEPTEDQGAITPKAAPMTSAPAAQPVLTPLSAQPQSLAPQHQGVDAGAATGVNTNGSTQLMVPSMESAAPIPAPIPAPSAPGAAPLPGNFGQ